MNGAVRATRKSALSSCSRYLQFIHLLLQPVLFDVASFSPPALVPLSNCSRSAVHSKRFPPFLPFHQHRFFSQVSGSADHSITQSNVTGYRVTGSSGAMVKKSYSYSRKWSNRRKVVRRRDSKSSWGSSSSGTDSDPDSDSGFDSGWGSGYRRTRRTTFRRRTRGSRGRGRAGRGRRARRRRY